MPCRRLSNFGQAQETSRTEMRLRIRRRRMVHRGLLRQSVAMHGKQSTDPERIGKMIPARVRRVRMDQNAQSSMVEHQPGHQFGKYLRGKGHLKHGLIVR